MKNVRASREGISVFFDFKIILIQTEYGLLKAAS